MTNKDLIFQQTKSIIKKNFILQFRNRSELFSELIVPLISAIIIFASEGKISRSLLPIYLPSSVTGFSRRHLITFVQEKEEKYKETQKIMGMNDLAYFMGWLITSYIKVALVGLVVLTSLYVSGNVQDQNFVEICILFTIYLICSVHQSFALSCGFSQAKLAGEIGTFIITIGSLLYFYSGFVNELSFWEYFVILLVPQTAISFCIIKENNSYNEKMAAYMLVFDCFLYLLIFFWANQFLQIKKLFRSNIKKEDFKEETQFYLVEMKAGDNQDPNFAPYFPFENNRKQNEETQVDKSSAYYHEKNIKQSNLLCNISNLTKKFGKNTAVNNISLSLYENEIFCLLGHNGAGKTTTISILTGLLEKTSGEITIFGKELENNLEEIRKNIGFCCQKDILYDDLTVFEQLEYTSNLKGVSKCLINKEIQKISKEVGIQNELNKYTKHLSGGNKRKLSLANALIGGSRLIFLDEPTSGMDAVSRKEIWKILENIKNEGNKCIVLTTHHLEEAENLAQRIAILENGKLLVVGSSQYIKNIFAVGYWLNLECKETNIYGDEFEKNKEFIINKVLLQIKGSKKQEQNSLYQLKFLLPFEQMHDFSPLLNGLEKINYISISLEMNSLEDTFVKIGEKNLPQDQNDDLQIQYQESDILPSERTIFIQQIIAFAKRQFYLTYRNQAALLMLFLPILFNFLGVYMAKNILENIQEYLNLGNKDSQIEELFPIKMYFLTIFIVQAYSMSTSIYINTPVLEREKKILQILKCSGRKNICYWLGTFIVDYISYLITVIIFIWALSYSKVGFLEGLLTKMSIILGVFGSSLILFTYVCSYTFNKSSSAFKTFPILSFFVSYSVPWIILQVTRVNYKRINIMTQILGICSSPFLMLEKALENIQEQKLSVDNSNDDFLQGQLINSWQGYAFCLLFQGFLFSLIIFFLDNFQFRKQNKNNLNNPQQNQQNQQQEENGVQKEIERVEKWENKDPIKAYKIHKIYDNGFHAVKGTTFGVQKGEIFGLLGPNGAGKTTSFRLLTKAVESTNGHIELNGKNIDEINEEIIGGVCSQEDCLWEYMNAREHLQIFGRIKGLSGKELKRQVDKMETDMQLEDFQVYSNFLSGGNKRKLSVACALLQQTNLMFFDEPSTGMDPIAKRFLQKRLRQGLEQRSLLLTTHSLQEAQDLCARVAIQVNGRFVCVGSIQELRQIYGNGQKIQIRVKNQESLKQKVKEEISNKFNEVKILQEFQDDGQKDMQKIIFQSNIQSFSQAFNALYDNLVAGGFAVDFSINQTSLEDIFLYFSQFQINNNQQN